VTEQRVPGTAAAVPLADGTATVPANRWELLGVPAVGDWTPTDRVSVVIPAKGATENLTRCLVSLAAQTYPAHLLDVAVVDDGSEPPLAVPDPAALDGMLDGLTVRLHRQESDGRFGAGRARNRGAAETDSEILLFLDADMLAEPTLVEEHARWHHVCHHAVLTGVIRFVEIDLDPVALGRQLRSGGFAAHVGDREFDSQEWRLKHFDRTHDLTADDPGIFRSAVGAIISVRRALFDRAGGFRELGIRGIEDTELGYRLHVHGGVFVVERSSHPWHQGRRFFDGAKADAVKTQREPVRRDLIPVAGMRPRPAPQVYQVPTVVVTVTGVEAAHAAAVTTLRRAAPADVLVVAGGEPEGLAAIDAEAVPYRLRVDADRLGDAVLDRKAYERLLGWLERGLGVVHLVDPDGDGGASVDVLTAWTARAVNRARLSGAPGDGDGDDAAVLALAGRLFGERWMGLAELTDR
jgi:GT2 family glycosyltransferase